MRSTFSLSLLINLWALISTRVDGSSPPFDRYDLGYGGNNSNLDSNVIFKSGRIFEPTELQGLNGIVDDLTAEVNDVVKLPVARAILEDQMRQKKSIPGWHESENKIFEKIGAFLKGKTTKDAESEYHFPDETTFNWGGEAKKSVRHGLEEEDGKGGKSERGRAEKRVESRGGPLLSVSKLVDGDLYKMGKFLEKLNTVSETKEPRRGGICSKAPIARAMLSIAQMSQEITDTAFRCLQGLAGEGGRGGEEERGPADLPRLLVDQVVQREGGSSLGGRELQDAKQSLAQWSSFLYDKTVSPLERKHLVKTLSNSDGLKYVLENYMSPEGDVSRERTTGVQERSTQSWQRKVEGSVDKRWLDSNNLTSGDPDSLSLMWKTLSQ